LGQDLKEARVWAMKRHGEQCARPGVGERWYPLNLRQASVASGQPQKAFWAMASTWNKAFGWMVLKRAKT